MAEVITEAEEQKTQPEEIKDVAKEEVNKDNESEEVKKDNEIEEEEEKAPVNHDKTDTTSENEETENSKIDDSNINDNTNNDDSQNENNDENSDESSEEELGSLEKPIEILTKKRDRKSTERFVDKKEEEKKEKTNYDYTKGKGKKLGDIEFVSHMITKTKAEELKPIHRLLYGSQGKVSIVRSLIRQFQGLPFEKDTKDHERAVARLERTNMNVLKFACGIMGLEKGGDKPTVVQRLLDYLYEPADLEKPIPKSRTKKRSATGKSKKKSNSKKSKKDITDGDQDDDNVSDESDDEEKSKSKASPKKKTPKKKDSPKKKVTTQVKIAMPTKKKSKNKDSEAQAKRKRDESDDESDDDLPIAKKCKPEKKEPTDGELEVIVQELLKDADLEQVTMKTICKQVYERFPDFDLTPRKDFIKTTVKKIIS